MVTWANFSYSFKETTVTLDMNMTEYDTRWYSIWCGSYRIGQLVRDRNCTALECYHKQTLCLPLPKGELSCCVLLPKDVTLMILFCVLTCLSCHKPCLFSITWLSCFYSELWLLCVGLVPTHPCCGFATWARVPMRSRLLSDSLAEYFRKWDRFGAGSSSSHRQIGIKAIRMTGTAIEMKGTGDELHPNYWAKDLHFNRSHPTCNSKLCILTWRVSCKDFNNNLINVLRVKEFAVEHQHPTPNIRDWSVRSLVPWY